MNCFNIFQLIYLHICIYSWYITETLHQDIANNLPGPLCIAEEGEYLDDYKMTDVHCYKQEEGNLNTTAEALLLGNNQQADVIDGYLHKKFHRTVTAVENYSDADCNLPFGFCNLHCYLLDDPKLWGEIKLKGEEIFKTAHKYH